MQLEGKRPDKETNGAVSQREATAGAFVIPEDALIILPVRQMVLFPGMILSLHCRGPAGGEDQETPGSSAAA